MEPQYAISSPRHELKVSMVESILEVAPRAPKKLLDLLLVALKNMRWRRRTIQRDSITMSAIKHVQIIVSSLWHGEKTKTKGRMTSPPHRKAGSDDALRHVFLS